MRSVRARLTGGDRRSVGRANDVARELNEGSVGCGEVVALLFAVDPIVRMRAADALEKASALRPALLTPFRATLLRLVREEKQMEVRWHLAQMIPRLRLSSAARAAAVRALERYLNDSSSIVRTYALEAIVQILGSDPRNKVDILELLRDARRSGSPAMRARARKLLKKLE